MFLLKRIVFLVLGTSLVAFAADSPTPVPQYQSPNLHSDIQYAQAGDEKLLLDAYVPEGPGPFPVAIVVHGGGWGSGDKKGDITPLLDPLAKANFTWFSIDYRLAPKYQWPACFDDVQTAIRWIKAHAADYKGDPARIALIGYSAGGNLATLAAVRAGADTRVQAVVGLAPPTDMPADTVRRGNLLSKSLQALFGHAPAVDADAMEKMQDMSAISHLQPGLPPFLLIHGTEDQSVAYTQSINFQAKLKENKTPCDLITIQGAGHRIADWDKFDPTYKDRMITWLVHTLGNRQ
jgi:acetyl esterase/lipase